MKNILVVGSMNMDLSIEVDRAPKIGETLVGRGFSTAPGGKGANQAIAAARLGGNVRFLGAVGKDSYGTQLTENLKKNNIAYEGAVLENTTTGIAMITVCNGNNFILLDSGANDCVTPAMLEGKKDLFSWADFVILQLEIPMDAVLCAAKLGSEFGAKVLLNPAPYKPLPDELFPYLDYLIPNEHEASDIVGFAIETDADAENAIEALLAKGIKNVVITLGDKGCVYKDETGIRFQAAEKVKAIDTTAAGDTFIGALVSKLCEGKDMQSAVQYATHASAVTVTRRGAADSIPFASELEMV